MGVTTMSLATLDIKKYRENHLNMSVEEVADCLQYEVQEIMMMEELSRYSTEYIQDFCDYFNVDPLALQSGPKKSKKSKLKIELNDWQAIKDYKNTLLTQLDGNLFDISTLKKQEESKFLNNQYTKTLKSLKETQQVIKNTLRKPTIAIVGMSDAGKSTLINELLDSEKMPVSWTPTTSITVIIKHIDDRPDFLKEELVILGGHKTLFRLDMLDSESYVRQYIMAEGDTNLLHEYGTRQGRNMALNKKNTDSEENGPTHAILYLDSEILKVCDFVDLPGFGTGDAQDDKLAQQSYNFADIVIYLSVSNGFLRGTDIEFIKTSLQSLTPMENSTNNLKGLRNFYIVASQADVVNGGNKNELDIILEKGAERLYNEIPSEVWEQREKQTGEMVTKNALRERFFTFTKNSPFLRRDFENDVQDLLKAIPQLVLEKSKTVISGMVYNHREQLENQLQEIHSTMTQYEKMLGEYTKLKNEDGEKVEKVLIGRTTLFEKLNEKEEESIKLFDAHYQNVMSDENIISIIDKNGYKKKKQDLQNLVGYITTQLQTRLQDTLSEQAKQFQKDIEAFLEEYDKAIPINNELNGIQQIKFNFNVKAVFAGAVASLGTLGALSIWAASFGNLGAYILIAKGVSLLSAVGISVGGTAAAAAGVASIGGPIVVGLVLAAFLGIGVWKLFSGSWKKDTCKNLNKQFTKQNVKNTLMDEVRNFWKTTRNEVTVAIDTLEAEYQEKLNELEENLKQAKSDQLTKKQKIVELGISMYSDLAQKV